MSEKELTKKVTKIIKDLDKLVQVAEEAMADLKKLGEGKEKDDAK